MIFKVVKLKMLFFLVFYDFTCIAFIEIIVYIKYINI